MPRKKTVTSAPVESKGQRKSNRHDAKEGGIPEIYREMLVEAAISSPSLVESHDRAVKRRRVEELHPRTATPEPEILFVETQEDNVASDEDSALPKRAPQTISDDDTSSDDSQAGFEDVDLEPRLNLADGGTENEKPLELDLTRPSGHAETSSVQRRKPATSLEKRLRLDVHKWHVLCLLLHGHYRNRWCDNEDIQAILKPMIPRNLIRLLHMNESKPQFARNHGFNKAIEEISDIWKEAWTTTVKGIRRAFWTEDPDILRDVDDLEDPIDLDDFKEAARTMSGSRDIGAQLFCALLRSVAVDARLVFSLQPLTFTGIAKGLTSEKPKPQYIYASPAANHAPQEGLLPRLSTATPSNARWRASEHASEHHTASPRPTSTPSSKKRFKDSPYPIFWVEVYSPSIDKWIPVDPLVRHTFNKPRTGYEPPASDRLNSMSYVVAFEDDGSAKDVTRRYASQYNAKTRKIRVESTKGGEQWWRRTMGFLERASPEMRDEIEDNELAAREAQEGMPKNVNDFKGHPIYALERHLRRNEVIYPLREAGKFSAGSVRKVEPVYRRKDVHVVRSADQWYRRGRDVKEGEQPLKRAVVRRSNQNAPLSEDDVGEDATGLYAEFQTEIYKPPPAVDGKIPRNVYGNLDVYVPTMIPAGAIHLQHPLAARVARLLGVDYAEAVTGFDFKGRQGTAIVNGIVAAAEYREALVEVIKAMEQEQAEAEQTKRTQLALQMWRRFMAALRIKEKIDKEYADDSGSEDAVDDPTYTGSVSGDSEAGGGFLPDAETNEPDAPPSMALSAPEAAPRPFVPSVVVVIESPHRVEKPASGRIQQKLTRFDSLFDDDDAEDDGGAYGTKDVEQEEGGGGGGGFIPEYHAGSVGGGGFIPEEDAGSLDGGGFIPEGADDDEGGGFIHDEDPESPNLASGQGPNLGADIASTADAGQLDDGPEPPTQTAPAHEHPLHASASTSPATATAVGRKTLPENLTKVSSTASNASAPPAEDVAMEKTSDSMDDESLLSHDPEDEDAEPEWLVDDEEL